MKKVKTALLLVFCFLLAACSGQVKQTEKDNIEHILRIGNLYDLNNNSGATKSLIFDSLTQFDEHMEPCPHLVSWDAQSEGREYILTLKEGVQFHDGSLLTADLVKWNIENLGKLYYCGYTSYLKDVEVLDDSHLKVALSKSYLFFPSDIARIFVVQKDAVDPDYHLTNFNGTGPYILEEHKPDQIIVLKRNDQYWNEEKKPAITKVEILPIPDSQSRAMALSSGQVDVVGLLEGYNTFPFSLIESTSKNPSIHLLKEEPSLFTSATCLGMNWQKGPCTDLNLRAAISTGIPREGLIKNVLFDFPELAEHYIGSAFWDFPKNVAGIKYDQAKSAEFLQRGGYEQIDGKLMKDGKQVSLNVVVSDQNEYKDTALYVQSELEKMGIAAELFVLDYDQAYERCKNLDFDITLSWPWYEPVYESLPYMGLTTEYNGMGLGSLIDPKMNDYADEFFSATNRKDAETAVAKIWDLQYKSYLSAPLYASARFVMHNDKYKGYCFESDIYHVDLSKLVPDKSED